MLAFITGSGLYDHQQLQSETTDTPFGEATYLKGVIGGREVLMLPRHGAGHACLPHQINHLAHLFALKQAGAHAVISCSVCGVLNPDWPLGIPLVAKDLYFPDNRLGDGRVCSIFQTPGEPGRGHLLAESHFHADSSLAIANLAGDHRQGAYGHVAGPRFNSKIEVGALQKAGVDFISQTCGPEAVLANELELPYALAAFGIDYANGVVETPTPIELLQQNLEKSSEWFMKLIEELKEPETGFTFENFIYRFD
ncbi:MTAP family purine nucleoside phosphorylase [Kiritimatiellaeota bacterium B1221]|nr:MTAP family purine nucleoside phosphorylase [Kiritimatiellaeota bacterium B1221]